MEAKVFGINEARSLAGEKKAHMPTIRAMLNILGIPNVVGKQANEAIVSCRKAIETATAKIVEARMKKENETARVSEAIAALNEELAAAVAEATGVEGSENRVIALTEKQILALEKLAKKFG